MDCDNCVIPQELISEEERDEFWKELKGCIEVCEDRGKVVVIGVMDARVRDSEVKGFVDKFGV